MNLEGTRVLLVNAEEEFCRATACALQEEGFIPMLAHDAKMALHSVRTASPAVVVADMSLPDLDGLELLRRVKSLDEDLPVVMITGHAEVLKAVEAMRASAHDYLAKPFQDHELIRAIHRAVAERQLKLKLKHLSSQIAANQGLTETMGHSDVIGQLIAEVNCVAKSNFSVVMVGETGSGKEVVARAIHQASLRARGPFVPVDCGAIPETLLEGELFGYERGAFTGAMGSKRGKFELAQGGTLFLDEILNLPLGSQAKLLRAIQEKTIYRLGATCPLRVDVRVVVAASQDLHAAVIPGTFRVDLFYRLNEFTLRIPALRERKEDIIYLAKRFLDLTNTELNKTVKGFSEAAINALLGYPWPGNVRELRSTIRRAVLLADGMITETQLDIADPTDGIPPAVAIVTKMQTANNESPSLRDLVAKSVAAAEREAVVQALLRAAGNKAQAARLLQIDYKTMQSKVKKYRITLNKKQSYENQTQRE
jgi:two-component system nitrogen regulation response regulator GlnG